MGGDIKVTAPMNLSVFPLGGCTELAGASNDKYNEPFGGRTTMKLRELMDDNSENGREAVVLG